MSAVLIHGEVVVFHHLDVETQHRRIAQLINDFATALENRRPASHVLDALDRLTEYVQLHCADEEQFLEEQGYPEELLRAHRAEHRDCIDCLHETRRHILTGAQAKTRPAEKIRAIIDSHSGTADRAYMDYFSDALRDLRS